MTKVLFLIEDETEVFAFFPEMKEDEPDGFLPYSHVGQHCKCHIDYANECKEAIFSQYADLLKELIGQGYNDLCIMNNDVIEYHRKPTKEEIKFGEGATHYRSFILNEIGVNKTGKLKKWFVALDGLRYYR